MSFYLSLDETAESEDQQFEVDGVPFVAAPNAAGYLEGLVIDVLNYWGRDNLVAHHPGVSGC